MKNKLVFDTYEETIVCQCCNDYELDLVVKRFDKGGNNLHKQIKKNGWIIDQNGGVEGEEIYFCSKECQEHWYAENK